MGLVDHLDPAMFDLATPAGADFYAHVNGGWLQANPVPPEYPAWGAGLEVHVRNEQILHDVLLEASRSPAVEGSPAQMVGDYYAAGMDEAAIAEEDVSALRPRLEAIASIESVADVRERMLELVPLGVGALHGLGIAPDFENADRYLVYLGQGGLGLPERDYYLREDERSMSLAESYREHVARQLGHLGVGGPDEARAIFELEKSLAAASLPAEKLRDLQLTLNRHAVDDLDTLMPGFGLTGYVRALGVGSESVNVDNPGFFTELDALLASTDPETIRAYLAWHLVRRYASALPRRFEEEAFDFYNRKLGGQQQPRERWTRVLGAATADIGEQVARLYVERAFSSEAKARAERMVEGLLEAMERSIRDLDWMGEATKGEALAKLEGFSYKIGYPDEWRDYTGLEIGRDSHVSNRMASSLFEFAREMGRLDDPVDKGEWAMPAHMVNAYYHPLLNEIVFPAGILQPPFFYPDADDAVNYGAIGSVIGHEITHGFDDNGSQFDAQGRKRNWWSDDDRAEFERRAESLVAQFAQYEVGEDQRVNGKLTVGENIADLGGLAIAYRAFLATLEEDSPDIGGFSPRQRFFLSYATIWRMNYTDEYLRMLVNVDVHAPNRCRVNGPLSNHPQFAEVFALAQGMPLRRPEGEVVRIW
ncbi:MAG TPA: M13 family metallopeptidase [Acidimicrobiia bacterium]|nr:M13 family metallopeptidase [Acidimicrobiia bacterium]